MNSQYDKEKESFLKATELNPNNADNWYKLGISYFNDKQYDKAIESFSKAVELNPNDDNNWDRLANSYQMNGQYDKAIETLLKAIEIDPNSRYYWFNLGILYYYNERYREAIDSLSKALELLNIEEEEDKEDFWDTDSSADYRYWLGRSYYMNEQCQEAINYLSKAVELNPDDYFNWYFLGSSYLDLKDYDNAVYSFNQCIKIDPNNEVVRDILQILQSSNGGVSLDGVVSGISKGIDTLNELSGKINPSTIGMVVGAAKLVGKFFGGSNKNK